MIRNKKGEQLFKHLEFKVFVGGKIFPIKFTANPGKYYGPANIEHELGRVVEYIDQKFPNLEFRMVELLPNRFNFIAVGQRGKVNYEEGKQANPGEVEAAVSSEAVDHPDSTPGGPDGRGEESERTQRPDLQAGTSAGAGEQTADSGGCSGVRECPENIVDDGSDKASLSD